MPVRQQARRRHHRLELRTTSSFALYLCISCVRIERKRERCEKDPSDGRRSLRTRMRPLCWSLRYSLSLSLFFSLYPVMHSFSYCHVLCASNVSPYRDGLAVCRRTDQHLRRCRLVAVLLWRHHPLHLRPDPRPRTLSISLYPLCICSSSCLFVVEIVFVYDRVLCL